MIDPNDPLLGFDNPNSVLRKLMEREEPVDLRDYELPKFGPIEEGKLRTFKVSDLESKARRNLVGLMTAGAENLGFSDNIYAGLTEAVRNAIQHGNHNIPDKKVYVSYDVDSEKATYIVGDQGGVLKPAVIPFLWRYAEGLHETKGILSFYKFSGYPRPEENAGIGIYTIHSVFDEVKFGRWQDEGFAISMTKFKEKQ